MSKIPRLPGDGAQANFDSNFDESTAIIRQTRTNRPSGQTLRDSFIESERHEGEHNSHFIFALIIIIIVNRELPMRTDV